MIKLESFNKDALHSNLNKYFKIVEDDCNNIKDIRFLVLRFCIGCEKVIDDFLSQYIQKNNSEIEDIKNIQLTKYKIGDQNCLVKLKIKDMDFARKIAIMQSICDYKNVDVKYFDFLTFLRGVRNIVSHQLVEEIDIQQYLNKNKEKFVYCFVQETMKPLFASNISKNNYHEVLKGLLPIISIEINELQNQIINH